MTVKKIVLSAEPGNVLWLHFPSLGSGLAQEAYASQDKNSASININGISCLGFASK